MLRYHTDQIACSSPFSSSKSSAYKHHFARSQQLNSAYRPNFKKLSSQRNQYHSTSQIQLRQLFTIKSIQKIITEQWNMKKQTCALCEDSYQEKQMFELCKCKHRYCEHCLIQYVSYQINAMVQIQCPDEFCVQKIDLQGEIYQKLPFGLKRKYRKAQMWRQNIGNPDLKLCPIEYCQGLVDMKLSPPTCTKCHKEYCQQCMMQKHVGNCDAIYQMTHKQWRRCPHCRMFITKTEGCNHIRCRCSGEFCFVCLQVWDNSHYNCMEKVQMFYFNMDRVKCPLVIAALMILLFPILTVLSVIGLVACFAIMIPVGFVMGLGLMFMKYYHLCCLVVILLPIGGAIGLVVFPFYFTFGHVIPHFIHHFRRYKITLQELFIKLSETAKPLIF